MKNEENFKKIKELLTEIILESAGVITQIKISQSMQARIARELPPVELMKYNSYLDEKQKQISELISDLIPYEE